MLDPAFTQMCIRDSRNTELFYEKRVPQKSPEFKDGQSILQQITEEDKLLDVYKRQVVRRSLFPASLVSVDVPTFTTIRLL